VGRSTTRDLVTSGFRICGTRSRPAPLSSRTAVIQCMPFRRGEALQARSGCVHEQLRVRCDAGHHPRARAERIIRREAEPARGTAELPRGACCREPGAFLETAS
jgi:hypothetical protein